MRKIGVMMLAGIIGLAWAARRSRHSQLAINLLQGTRTDLDVGTPPQRLNAQFDTRSAHIIIMDAACQNPRLETDCPLYCNDLEFRPIYCSPFCVKVTEVDEILRCGNMQNFNSTLSTSFSNGRRDVSQKYRELRPLNGRLGADVLRPLSNRIRKAMPSRYRNKTDTGITVFFEMKLPFVRGFSFDRRTLQMTSAGAIGLSPRTPDGSPSLIPQLKAMGFVDRARISIQHVVPPTPCALFFRHAETATFGDFERHSCLHWTLFPAYGPDGWTFEMENVKFAGEAVPGQHIGRIAFDNKYVAIPEALVRRHLQSGLFFTTEHSTAYRYRLSDWHLIRLEFTAAGRRIVLDPKTLIFEVSKVTWIVSNGESRYSDESQWAFGTGLLDHVCYGYDYDVGAVAWAERRRVSEDWAVDDRY